MGVELMIVMAFAMYCCALVVGFAAALLANPDA
jgi:hypothetical protein